jgi:hypothetical protein
MQGYPGGVVGGYFDPRVFGFGLLTLSWTLIPYFIQVRAGISSVAGKRDKK